MHTDAAAIKRDHALLTNDGRKGCAYILQYRDDRFGNSCSVSIGTSTCAREATIWRLSSLSVDMADYYLMSRARWYTL